MNARESILLAESLRELVEYPIHAKSDLKTWYQTAQVLANRLKKSEFGGTVPDEYYEEMWHFLSDADIRFKDRVYANRQISMIRELIEALESGYRDENGVA